MTKRKTAPVGEAPMIQEGDSIRTEEAKILDNAPLSINALEDSPGEKGSKRPKIDVPLNPDGVSPLIQVSTDEPRTSPVAVPSAITSINLPSISSESVSGSATTPVGSGTIEEQPATALNPEQRESRNGNIGCATDIEAHTSPKYVDCVICCESKILPENTLTSRCKHTPNVCSSCISQYVKTEVLDKRETEIPCIESGNGCKELLDYEEMKASCDESTFDQYDDYLLAKLLRQSQQLCVCTRPGCINIQETAGQFMKCRECGWLTCVHHKVKMHEGMTCEEYDKTIAHVKFDDNTKPCPLCKTGIEKIEGCDHMRCSKSAGGCGAEFCWSCSVLYTGEAGINRAGNSAHKATCRHFRGDPNSPKGIEARRFRNRLNARAREVRRMQLNEPSFTDQPQPHMNRREVELRLAEAEEMVTQSDARIQGLINREVKLKRGSLLDAVREQGRARRERARLQGMLN